MQTNWHTGREERIYIDNEIDKTATTNNNTN